MLSEQLVRSNISRVLDAGPGHPAAPAVMSNEFTPKMASTAEEDAMRNSEGVYFRNKMFKDKYWEIVVRAKPADYDSVPLFRFEVPLWNPSSEMIGWQSPPMTKTLEILSQDGFNLVVRIDRSCLFAHDAMWADMGDGDLKPLPICGLPQFAVCPHCGNTAVIDADGVMQIVPAHSRLATLAHSRVMHD